MPKTLSPIIRIAKYTLTDEIRQKSFIIMFVICAIFIFLVRGCYQGNYMVNGQTLDAETIIRIVSKLTFHVIAAGAMLLTALLSMRVFRRDRDEGMQSCILSKPIARWQYVAGKILGLVGFIDHLHVHPAQHCVHNCIHKFEGCHAGIPHCLTAMLFQPALCGCCCISFIAPDVRRIRFSLCSGNRYSWSGGRWDIRYKPQSNGAGDDRTSRARSQTGHGGKSFTIYGRNFPVQRGLRLRLSAVKGFGSIYPLINVLFYVLILGTLLFWRFRNEDII